MKCKWMECCTESCRIKKKKKKSVKHILMTNRGGRQDERKLALTTLRERGRGGTP